MNIMFGMFHQEGFLRRRKDFCDPAVCHDGAVRPAQGQALAVVLILITMGTAIAAALTFMWRNQTVIFQQNRDRLAAFYAAEAGLAHAKMEAVNNPVFSGWLPCDDEAVAACWYSFPDRLRYRFRITQLGGNRRRLESFAEKTDAAGQALLRRSIRCEVNIASERQEPWTWEILQ